MMIAITEINIADFILAAIILDIKNRALFLKLWFIQIAIRQIYILPTTW